MCNTSWQKEIFINWISPKHTSKIMLLHPDDQKYTTVNTHLVLFQYIHLPFGIVAAPAIFQQVMEILYKAFQGQYVILMMC